MLPSVNTFFKIERDSLFKLGIEKGEKEVYEFVTNLVEKFGFNDNQATDEVNVLVAFVKEMRKLSGKADKKFHSYSYSKKSDAKGLQYCFTVQKSPLSTS